MLLVRCVARDVAFEAVLDDLGAVRYTGSAPVLCGEVRVDRDGERLGIERHDALDRVEREVERSGPHAGQGTADVARIVDVEQIDEEALLEDAVRIGGAEI